VTVTTRSPFTGRSSARDAGVDQINTDDLIGRQAFLTAND
jgi:hypothetical protein